MKEPILPHVEACLERWHCAFLGIFAAMFTLYLPVVTGTYVYLDDWYTFVWDRSDFLGYPTVRYLIHACGRPLGGLFLSLSQWFAGTFRDAQVVRLVLIAVQSLTATIFFFTLHGILSRFRVVTRLECLLLTLFVFSLPPFQTYVAYISNGIDVLGILFGTLAAASFMRFAEAEGRGLRHFWTGSFWSATGLLIYPATTMVVWAFIGLAWAAMDAKTLLCARRFFIRLCLAPLASIVAYAVYARILSHSTTRIRFETRPAEKLFWFFRQPLMDALNLWDLFPARWILPAVVCAIGSGFLFRFLNDLRVHPSRKGGALIALSLRFLAVLSCALLCVLPNLASGDQSHALRSIAPLFCLVPSLLLLSVREGLSTLSLSGGKAPAAALGLLCAVGFAYAHHNVSNLIVFPSTLEMRFIKSRLQQVDLHQYKRIHILAPIRHADSLVIPVSRGDEFAIATTGAAQTICPMVRGIFKDLGYPLTHYVDLGWGGMELNEWRVSFGTSEEEAGSFPEPTLMIDMRRLRYF